MSTKFHDNEIPKDGSRCICLSVILINSVFRTGKNYYPQAFLEECKYAVKEKKMPKYMLSPDEENFDKVNSDKENSDEENYSEE